MLESQHYFKGVLLIMDGDLKSLMNFIKRKMMGVQSGKIISVPDPVHESNSSLGEVFRAACTGNVQGSPDGFSDFKRNFSSNGVTNQTHPGAVS